MVLLLTSCLHYW